MGRHSNEYNYHTLFLNKHSPFKPAFKQQQQINQIFIEIFIRCCCGQSRITHPVVPGVEIGSPGDIWIAHKHTRPHPTDAYGTIEFQGGAHPTKAQVRPFIYCVIYVR